MRKYIIILMEFSRQISEFNIASYGPEIPNCIEMSGFNEVLLQVNAKYQESLIHQSLHRILVKGSASTSMRPSKYPNDEN